jgi:S-adenosylmethionine synthetase
MDRPRRTHRGNTLVAPRRSCDHDVEKDQDLSYLFTSESVSEGHPDKVADAISDAVLDLIMREENDRLRCACETLVTTDRVVVAGEYKGILHPEEIDSAVRRTIRRIGYEQPGFDWRTVEITNLMHGQSADIALGTDSFGAGDQGLMFGFACDQTPDLMPAAIYYSHRIMSRLAQIRKEGIVDWLRPDAKCQVTLEYDHQDRPQRAVKIVVSTQHSESVDQDVIQSLITGIVYKELGDLVTDDTDILVNPTGRFVTGGPDGDTGLTGRKIIVDSYGGAAPHGGGAFSGKDPTKVDRSAAYLCRWLAKNIVASGRATRATLQISYAIGIPEPMSLRIDSDGDDVALLDFIQRNVDLTPRGIIDRFRLFRPIYSETTNYGHFGKHWLPWEDINLF